jgi:WD40 repeat protein
MVYCAELKLVISGSCDNTARVWNLTTLECVHVLRGHTDKVLCAAVHKTTYVCVLMEICGKTRKAVVISSTKAFCNSLNHLEILHRAEQSCWTTTYEITITLYFPD